ncbi:MAG: DedA family protein [Candidatus Eremiobacteraeota bacterium]|nr:DedA family protein [Candidatus Eremiobacteraeota bacterium]
MEHLSAFFLTLVDHAGYLGLFVAMAAGNVGAPIGSEIILPAAGALVATGHLDSIYKVIVFAVLGELAGGTLGYAIGRFGGRPFVHKYGHLVMFHEEEMAKVDSFFGKYGSFAIFICRFVPVIRGVVSIPAGITRMPLVPFYLWYALGSLGFCGILAVIGESLGKNLDTIVPLLHKFSIAIAAIVVLAVIYAMYRLIKARRAHAAP